MMIFEYTKTTLIQQLAELADKIIEVAALIKPTLLHVVQCHPQRHQVVSHLHTHKPCLVLACTHYKPKLMS